MLRKDGITYCTGTDLTLGRDIQSLIALGSRNYYEIWRTTSMGARSGVFSSAEEASYMFTHHQKELKDFLLNTIPVIKNISNGQVQQIPHSYRQEEERKLNKHFKEWKEIVTAPEFFELLDQAHKNIATIGSYAAPNSLGPEDFAQCVERLNDSPLFTKEFKSFFALSKTPIVITPRVILSQSSDKAFGLSADDGVCMASYLFPDPAASVGMETTQDNERVISKAFAHMAFVSIPDAQETFVNKDKKRWNKVLSEFKKHAERILPEDVIENDRSCPQEYLPQDILGLIHYALHSPHANAEEIRQTMPECVKFYDAFIQQVKAHNKELTKRTFPNLPAYKPAPVLEPVPEPKQEEKAAPAWEAPLEQFLTDAQTQTPPFNMAKCRILFSGDAKTIPIFISVHNTEGQERNYTLMSGTSSLDEAVALFKEVQWKVLSAPGIVPLRTYIGTEHRLGSDEVLPKTPPVSYELVPHHRLFQARLTFREPNATGEEQEFHVLIPLGLQALEKNRPSAEARMQEVIRKHEELCQGQQEWLTTADLARSLKQRVCGAHEEWKTETLSQPLDYYQDKERYPDGYPLAIPGTFITSATIRPENQDRKNPTWRLCLSVHAGNQDVTTSQNLHTNDEIAAQLRGIEAVDGLVRMCDSLGAIGWGAEAPEGGGPSLLYPEGKILEKNAPRCFEELCQDMPVFKGNFRIACTDQQREGNHVTLTLGLERGTAHDGDLAPFHNEETGRPIACTLSVPADQAAHIQQQIQQSFSSALESIYSNRVQNGEGEKRRTRQKYNWRTVKNLFESAVEQHAREYILASSFADEVTSGRRAAASRSHP